MGAIVAIVGRPNVGKSTFFNRLIQRREALKAYLRDIDAELPEDYSGYLN